MSDSKERLYQEGFSAEQVDAILQRAAELQTGSETAGVQLNKADLEAGAEAAGIDRAFIDRAIKELEAERAQQAARKRTRMIGGIILAAVVALWIFSAHFILNSRLSVVEEKQAQLENVLQRRHDLIPNLISVAKASAAHEKELIASISEMYQELEKNADFSERQTLEQNLESSVDQLMGALRENPRASSNALFIRLSDEMAGAENRIAVERMRYNQAVADYNRAARGMFIGVMRPLLGFPAHIPPFQASEAARKPATF